MLGIYARRHHTFFSESLKGAEQSLWRIWARSGDPDIDKLYETGIEQMNAGELKQAIASGDAERRRGHLFVALDPAAFGDAGLSEAGLPIPGIQWYRSLV